MEATKPQDKNKLSKKIPKTKNIQNNIKHKITHTETEIQTESTVAIWGPPGPRPGAARWQQLQRLWSKVENGQVVIPNNITDYWQKTI